jgi:sarcosine oxidase subunit gamma
MAEIPASPPAPDASPLDGIEMPHADGIAAVSAEPPAQRISLRLAEADVAAVGTALGVALDARINTAATSADGAFAALRLGPDEWLLVTAPGSAHVLQDRTEAATASRPASVVDLSDRTVALGLAGPEVEAVLAAGCPLPLDAASFPPGRATRTLLGKTEVVLWRQAGDRFRIEVARSFAPYLVGFLGEAIAAEAAIAALRSRQAG